MTVADLSLCGDINCSSGTEPSSTSGTGMQAGLLVLSLAEIVEQNGELQLRRRFDWQLLGVMRVLAEAERFSSY